MSDAIQTQVAFLIDFNSFDVIIRPRTVSDNSATSNGTKFPNNASTSINAPVPVPSTTVVTPSTSAGPSRIVPSTGRSQRDRELGSRYCLYPTLQALTKTPPRQLVLGSDSDSSGDDDWPDSEQRQIREDQIAENLQWAKEIIVERLHIASMVGGRVETGNVQWAYQFFDSSHEVIKTKNNAKKFFKLDLGTLENFEKILEKELVEFVNNKRKLDKKKRKMLSRGESYFYRDEDSNRLTCLSLALKNIMNDIPWVDRTGPPNVKYNNILYILHHLPSTEREVNAFAYGHIPVGKSLNQKLLRDALLPPAFLDVLRDKLQIKLTFVDISNMGRVCQSMSTLPKLEAPPNDGQVKVEEDLDNEKAVLVIQKMLQLIHAKYETHPERHSIPLQFGTWYTFLVQGIAAAAYRAEKNLLLTAIVPFVDTKKNGHRELREREKERDKKRGRVSAESGTEGTFKDFENEPRHESMGSQAPELDSRNMNRRLVLRNSVIAARGPDLNEMSPTAKVGTWLGNESLVPIVAPGPPDQASHNLSRNLTTSSDAISLDSWAMDDQKIWNAQQLGKKYKYKPYSSSKPKVPQATAIGNQQRKAIAYSEQNQSQRNSGGYSGRDREYDRDQPSTSKAAQANARDIKGNSMVNDMCRIAKPPPNTSFIQMQNARRQLTVQARSARTSVQPKRLNQKAFVPEPKLDKFGFGGRYGTRSKTNQKETLPAIAQSSIAYVAPVPKSQPQRARGDSSPPPSARGNVRRNLHNLFDSVPVNPRQNQGQAGQGLGKTSVSKRLPTSPTKTTSGRRGRPPGSGAATQSKILKSKRKLQMDEDDEGEQQKDKNLETSPSQPIEGSSSYWSLAIRRLVPPSPKTPPNKRLKRLHDFSAEKTVVQESPQVTQRKVRARRDGGLSKVDPVSFYSYGSNESKAWEISGRKLAAQRLTESIEDSKAVLADLSANATSYEDFEILTSSSPECGPDSARKREMETEVLNNIKYFKVKPPSQSPLVLHATPDTKTAPLDDKSPMSPCIMKHFILPEIKRSALSKKKRAQASMINQESVESQGEVGEDPPKVSPSAPAKAEPKPEPIPSTSSTSTAPAPVDNQTPVAPDRKPNAGMMASFSDTSSEDRSALNIDALINGEILNTPTPARAEKKSPATTTDTVNASPPRSGRRVMDILSPDIINGHIGQTLASVAKRKRGRPPKAKAKAKPQSPSLASTRTPRNKAVTKRMLDFVMDIPGANSAVSPLPSSAPLSILSPSPVRTPMSLRQRTPIRPDSGSSSASQRHIFYSDTTPDKAPDFEKLDNDVGTEVTSTTSMTMATTSTNKTKTKTTASPATPATGSTGTGTSKTGSASTTKKKQRRKKEADWGERRRTRKNKKKNGNASASGTDESTYFSTPAASPVAYALDPYDEQDF